MSRPRASTIAAVTVPLAVVALLVAAWAIDTGGSGGRVVRNVDLAGRDIGGLREDALVGVVQKVAEDFADTDIEIRTTGQTYRTTAGDIGLVVDQDATVEAALEVGRDDPLPLRPVTWLGSFASPREAPVEFTTERDRLGLVLISLEGTDGRRPTEPSIVGRPDGVDVSPGVSGFALDPQDVATKLVAAAEAARDPLVIRTEPVEVEPTFTDAQAQALADEVEFKTSRPLKVVAADTSVEVPVATLRSWVGSTPASEGLELTVDGDKATADIEALLPAIDQEPADASITLGDDGQVKITPSRQGRTCCGPDTGVLALQAIDEGSPTLEVPLVTTDPEFTTEEAEALGIKEPVGTTTEWAGRTQVKSFTTYHACCEARVSNIHRMADLVRGAIILPGETFSINQHVGQRTIENGFVEAGAIANGQHSEEVGGGVSQFATTLFNAAFFAGLDYGEYQSHSIHFDRYPRGREATMGWEHPDLQIENTTPFGVMIWTSYTDTSLTITLYSTQNVYGQQTGQTESPQGNCTRVTTTRTRTWLDGHTEDDTVFAVYRPDFGINC